MRIDEFDFPHELFYTERHLWVRVEDSNLVSLGVDDLGQTLAGRIIFVRLLKQGTALVSGKVFGTLESLKWVERLRSPVEGLLEESNQALRSQADLVNKDSYGQGWLVKIRTDGSAEQQLKDLVHGDSVENWVRQELVKYQEQLKKKTK